MQPGDVVIARDECWMVARTEAFERCAVVTLEGRGAGNMGRRFQAVTPFEHIRTAHTDRPRRRKRRTVLRAALTAIAHERPALGLWTAADARLDLLAHQLEPALAVLDGATRVLLADAVGLGKTIQAGLILAELHARGLVDRALILCPAGLRQAWRIELRDRFGIEATVLDHSAIEAGSMTRPGEINPWATHPVIVSSIDFVKRPEVLAAAEGAAFDLVVADEAHHLTPASDRGQAVDRLALRAPWLVLMSATPHSGDQAAFDFLTGIGAHGDPLAVFRRSRRDIGLPGDRRSHLLCVTPTPDEARLLDAMAVYARAIWQTRGRSDRAVQLVALTLARRAASSAAAAGRTLVRRRALLAGEPLAVPVQGVLPWDEVDEHDGDEPDQRLACHGLADRDAEQHQLDALIALATRAASPSSKLQRLRRFLLRAGEPAVVFTEYRDTLHAAVEALTGAFRLGAIHGGLPAPLRQEIVGRFQRGQLDVLLATDTAGEGLNLHHHCRLVIDLELPWNPLRLEQRVGRVDRIGQQRRVHAVHLLHRGTVEEKVWHHLQQRQRRADNALGACAPPTDEDLAHTVFDHEPLPTPDAPAVPSMRVDGATREMTRVARQRHERRRAPAIFDRPVFALPQRGREAGAAIALVEFTQIGPAGGMVQRRVRAFVVSLHGIAGAAAWRKATSSINLSALDHDAEAQMLPRHEAMVSRLEAARTQLAATPPLHQASLFDRRAEFAAGIQREIAAQIDAALARRRESLLTDSLTAHQRLIAVWPLRRLR